MRNLSDKAHRAQVFKLIEFIWFTDNQYNGDLEVIQNGWTLPEDAEKVQWLVCEQLKKHRPEINSHEVVKAEDSDFDPETESWNDLDKKRSGKPYICLPQKTQSG